MPWGLQDELGPLGPGCPWLYALLPGPVDPLRPTTTSKGGETCHSVPPPLFPQLPHISIHVMTWTPDPWSPDLKDSRTSSPLSLLPAILKPKYISWITPYTFLVHQLMSPTCWENNPSLSTYAPNSAPYFHTAERAPSSPVSSPLSCLE